MAIHRSKLNNYNAWKEYVKIKGWGRNMVNFGHLIFVKLDENNIHLALRRNTDDVLLTYDSQNNITIAGGASNYLSKYLPHGRIFSTLFLPIEGYPLGYPLHYKKRTTFILSSINGIDCYVSPDINSVIYYKKPCRNLPLGNRWYVVENKNKVYGNFFQHRCERKIKATKFFSTECSLCGEDVTKVIDNLEEKIEATRAASMLKRMLKC